MRTLECIRFRSCVPCGRNLARHLFDRFSSKAKFRRVSMTVWLDNELPGDLCVQLEREIERGASENVDDLGLSIEKVLNEHGLVDRRILVSADEKD